MAPKKYHLIVGLGNPGKQYENTPHNVGYMAVDRLAEENGLSLKKKNLMPYLIAASLRVCRLSL